jgi:hypothetical protein
MLIVFVQYDSDYCFGRLILVSWWVTGTIIDKKEFLNSSSVILNPDLSKFRLHLALLVISLWHEDIGFILELVASIRRWLGFWFLLFINFFPHISFLVSLTFLLPPLYETEPSLECFVVS